MQLIILILRHWDRRNLKFYNIKHIYHASRLIFTYLLLEMCNNVFLYLLHLIPHIYLCGKHNVFDIIQVAHWCEVL